MKFLLDHDVPDEVEQLLRYWRHDVRRLREVLPVTSADAAVFEFAQREPRIIISCNRNHFLKLARQAVEKGQPFAGYDYSHSPANTAGGMRASVVFFAAGGRIGSERKHQSGMISSDMPFGRRNPGRWRWPAWAVCRSVVPPSAEVNQCVLSAPLPHRSGVFYFPIGSAGTRCRVSASWWREPDCYGHPPD